MATVRGLVDVSLNCSAEELSRLADDVHGILSRQRRSGKMDNATVEGGVAILPSEGEAVIVGDLHGDLDTLSSILVGSKFIESQGSGAPVYLVFMGDYGDRGPNSAEVYHVALNLKQMFPERVIIMRGNHEGPPDIEFYPFNLPEQFVDRFGSDGKSVLSKVQRLWESFFHGVIVESKYLILHGGVPTEAKSRADITEADSKHPAERHLLEILWNDPLEAEGFRPSGRGIGRLFGPNLTDRVLRLAGARTLIRGHEPCSASKVNQKGRVLTVFSMKGFYGNTYAGYLPLDLGEQPRDAYSLAERVVKL